MADIRARGLHEYGRSYNLYHQPLAQPEALFAKPDLTTEDTRGKHLPVEPAICACGDEEGAAHYAWRHNRHGEDDTPVMVSFEAPMDDVAVDGRDFLYVAFQLGVPDRARDVLTRVFGPRVLRYAERAWERKDGQYDIAMCDLATLDPEVIAAHHANRTVVAGRHRTVFRSAFTVRMPVEPGRILHVWSPQVAPRPTIPEVNLDDVR